MKAACGRLMMNHGGAAAVIAAAQRRGHQGASEIIGHAPDLAGHRF